jgi:hypothetical protein
LAVCTLASMDPDKGILTHLPVQGLGSDANQQRLKTSEKGKEISLHIDSPLQSTLKAY